MASEEGCTSADKLSVLIEARLLYQGTLDVDEYTSVTAPDPVTEKTPSDEMDHAAFGFEGNVPEATTVAAASSEEDGVADEAASLLAGPIFQSEGNPNVTFFSSVIHAGSSWDSAVFEEEAAGAADCLPIALVSLVEDSDDAEDDPEFVWAAPVEEELLPSADDEVPAVDADDAG